MNGARTAEERLAVIETLLGELKLQFTNHLSHHKKTEYILLAAVVGLVVKAVFFGG